MAKVKGCENVREWIKSRVNHLYWSALSTSDGDSQMMLEKWKSLATMSITYIEGMVRSIKGVFMDGSEEESG